MANITASVGRGGANKTNDVKIVQSALIARGYRLSVTGNPDRETLAAIWAFQGGLMAHPDGRIDASGKTWKALSQPVAGSRPPTAITTAPPPAVIMPPTNVSQKAKVDTALQKVPPLGSIITSSGATAATFTELTGWTQARLQAEWDKGRNLTTCAEFVGVYSIRMGCKATLGRFDLERYAKRAWIPSTPNGPRPKYGDILLFRKFHVGIALDFAGSMFNTAESGQGGPKSKYDALQRKQTAWNPELYKGWVDLEAWLG